MEALVALCLLLLLAAMTVAIVRVRGLFAVTVLTSGYSFLIASVMIVYDAVDVAMTEASVGAGISTVLLLGTLHLTRTTERERRRGVGVPLFVAVVTAGALIWGLSDLPPFGTADQPLHKYGPDYLARSVPDTGIPNVVTSVLASYRGFDTLGETTVIFTAGIAILALLKRRRAGPSPEREDGGAPRKESRR